MCCLRKENKTPRMANIMQGLRPSEDGGLVMRCKRCGKAKRTSKFFSDDQICGQCRIERNGDYTAKKSARAKKAYEAWKASCGKQDWRELRKQRKQQDERFVP